MRIRGLAQARVSYGYRRIHVLLRREGWQVNHKRVYRLYSLGGTAHEAQEAEAARIQPEERGQVPGSEAR